MTEELEQLIERAKRYVDGLTPEEYRAMVNLQAAAWVKAEMAWDEDATVIAV